MLGLNPISHQQYLKLPVSKIISIVMGISRRPWEESDTIIFKTPASIRTRLVLNVYHLSTIYV